MVRKKAGDQASFLLTNKIGGYISLSEPLLSRFQGVYFSDPEIVKVIENIKLLNAPEISNTTHLFWSVTRNRGDIKEKFFMPHGFNSLVYELNDYFDFELVLDIRHPYQNPEFGRHYEIEEHEGIIIINYKNENDDYTGFLVAVSNDIKFKGKNEWREQVYELDIARNSEPSKKHVFSAGIINAKRVVFSYSKNKEEAIEEAKNVLKNLDYLKVKQENNVKKLIPDMSITDSEAKVAYKCVANALDSLITTKKKVFGMYGGLWWFFQFWHRDEAISCGALIEMRKYDEAKQILFRIIGNTLEDGMIGNKQENADLKSADALGWAYHRLKQLYQLKQLNDPEISHVREKLKLTLKALQENHVHEDITYNDAKQTWMDSINREGARLEIQALRLSMLRFLRELEDSEEYKRMESKSVVKIKRKFWNGKFLADGINDITARPNAFIAYYLYPHLLKEHEWKECFDILLDKLWLSWGGIATIDKKSHYFVDEHTGENPRSYHNGDSWYWINNLVAICLHRLDAEYYRPHVRKILDASINQTLYGGIIGSLPELSSARECRNEGCPSQAWSMALFIELIKELYTKTKENEVMQDFSQALEVKNPDHSKL